MKIPVLFLLLAAAVIHAEDGAPVAAASPLTKWIAGVGAGFESGTGLQVGIRRGAQTYRTGFGFYFQSQDGSYYYSLGERVTHDLYLGKINDTYAWVGGAVQGGKSGTNPVAVLASVGAGVGASLHWELPFHFNVDSGWHLLRDNGASSSVEWGPTINGSVTYEW